MFTPEGESFCGAEVPEGYYPARADAFDMLVAAGLPAMAPEESAHASTDTGSRFDSRIKWIVRRMVDRHRRDRARPGWIPRGSSPQTSHRRRAPSNRLTR